MINNEDMAKKRDTEVQVFHLQTLNTSYIFRINEIGIPEQLYYGKKLDMGCDDIGTVMPETGAIKAITQKVTNPNGCGIFIDTKVPNMCLDDLCLEISTRGYGDMRDPMLELEFPNGRRNADFRYVGYRVEEGKLSPNGMPGAYFDEADGKYVDCDKSLVIIYEDKNTGVLLESVYTAFVDCDCITRFNRLINKTTDLVKINKMMSLELDVDMAEWKVTSFTGDWAREMSKNEVKMCSGKYLVDSSTGFSSNKANPFVMFGEENVGEQNGCCFATNLIYSGNHRESLEINSYGKARILTGINPDFFIWTLKPEESFDTPEAVLTFSDTGYEGISMHMHKFVREHIVRGQWKKKERPILVNSWEAMYFNIKEASILKLAKKAKEVGAELFVLDDGWFGKRDNDKSSLGDWYDHKKKLPKGLAHLADKVRKTGLEFGIWVEPEMVNEDSDLYRKHPDWVLGFEGKDQPLGRNQMLLDFSKKEVCDYIIEAMSDVFSRSNASYVKWDMNRNMADCYSNGCESDLQGEVAHRYILGLYGVMGELVRRFPHILFEGCASGGNRFDLGILSFMPQIWASDDTDAVMRAYIQNGYSYGYPQSVVSAHVSGCPNHQTLRVTPIDARFVIASAGVLGYECNLCDMPEHEIEEIKKQILIYKKWRATIQYGRMYRLGGEVCGEKRKYDRNLVKWNIVSEDKNEAVGYMLQGLALPNYSHHTFKTRGLDEDKMYHFTNRIMKHDIRKMGDLVNMISPVHIKNGSLTHNIIAKLVKLDGEVEDVTVSGNVLNNAGVKLAQAFAGTGYGDNTRIYKDFDARIYFIESESK